MEFNLYDDLTKRGKKLGSNLFKFSEGERDPLVTLTDILGTTGGSLMDVGSELASWLPDIKILPEDLFLLQLMGNDQGLFSSGQDKDVTSNMQDILGGGAMLLGGPKAIPRVRPEMRGYTTSALNNYITGYYTHEGVDLPKSLSRFVEEGSDNEKILKRLYGMGKWAAEQGANVGKATLNPAAKARYAEHGLSPETRKLVNKSLENPTGDIRQDIGVPQAEATYNMHIEHQAKREGLVHPALRNFGELGAYGNTKDMSQGFFRKFSEPHTSVKLSDNDWNIFEQHMRDIPSWKDHWTNPDSKIMIKRSNAATGNHQYDLTKKMPAVGALRKIFKDHYAETGRKTFKDEAELMEAIQSKRDKAMTPNTGFKAQAKYVMEKRKNPDAKKPENRALNLKYEAPVEGGVWLSNGFGGTAIVEGGVNGLIKVKPDGTIVGMLSDKHDFIEKVPLVNKAVPSSQMAVTTPFKFNIYDKGGKAGAKKKRASEVSEATRKKRAKAVKDKTAWNRFTSDQPQTIKARGEQYMEEISKLNPTAKGLFDEVLGTYGIPAALMVEDEQAE